VPNPDGQSLIDSTCAFGAGDAGGTCLSRVINGEYWAVCTLGGSAQLGQACDPEGSRANLTQVCAAGLLCGLNPSEASPVCDQVCDPLSNSQCAADGGTPYCQPVDPSQWPVELQPGLLGYCTAVSDGGPDDAGLCTSAVFLPCGSSSDCNCGLVCASDPSLGNVCELSCQSDSDCVDATTVCDTDAGACNLDVCANPPGSCTISGQDGGGTCVPVLRDGGTYGVCVASGTAGTGCDLRPTWQNPAGRCPRGSVCGLAQFGGTDCQSFCPATGYYYLFGSFDPNADMCGY
jgi:hypothetical protein